MKKRGAISDLALILGPMLALAITILIAILIWTEYSNELANAVDLDDFPRVRSVIEKTTTQAIPIFDKIFFAFTIALFLGTIILGLRLRTSAIFIAFIFIYMPLLVLLAKIVQDTYSEFSAQPAFGPAVALTPIATMIMTNLQIITIAFAIGLSIILFVVRRSESI